MDSLLVVEEHALTEDAYVRLVELLELFKFGPFVFQRPSFRGMPLNVKVVDGLTEIRVVAACSLD